MLPTLRHSLVLSHPVDREDHLAIKTSLLVKLRPNMGAMPLAQQRVLQPLVRRSNTKLVQDQLATQVRKSKVTVPSVARKATPRSSATLASTVILVRSLPVAVPSVRLVSI